MEMWMSVLAAITGNVIGSAVLGYLGQTLITNSLAREAKRFETQLKTAADTALEHLKSELQGRQQLRMAAMDKRLEVHQKAFWLWRKVKNATTNNSKIIPAFKECREWYYENCL
jgi:membrane protein YqaA with SNARE-associated domain